VKDEEAVVGTTRETNEKDSGHAGEGLEKETGPVHIER
jgi:hypothetical protein